MYRSLWLAAALALSAPAYAAELPASAGSLIPSTWSTPTPGAHSAAPWWAELGGTELTHIIAATATSPELGSAQASVRQARARTTQSTAGLAPSIDLVANGSYAPTDGMTTTTAERSPEAVPLPDTYTSGSLMVVATQPLTPWSAIPTQRAAQLGTDAARARHDSATVSVTVNATRRWLDVVMARDRVALVRSQAAADSSRLELIEARYERGEATALDVLQQRQQLAATNARLPAAEAMVGRTERTLASTLGLATTPRVLTAELPPVPALPHLGTPYSRVASDLDTVAAMADFQAARARSTAASAAFLPSVAATASAGWTYLDITTAETSDTWSVGLTASVPIFAGGRNVGARSDARAGQRVAEHGVQRAVLDAVRETEDAIAHETQRRAEVAAATAQLEAASAALTSSEAQYATGLVSWNTVLTTLQATQNAELGALQAHRNHLDAYLDLVTVTGDAWVDAL
jgi:outer membrane protein TolC